MTRQTKILILTADAGFGHRAAANAVAAALADRYGDACDTLIANPMNDPRTPAALRLTQSEHDVMSQQLPQVYELGYRVSDRAVSISALEAALIAMLYGAMRDVVEQFGPDVVVSTHPAYQAAIAAVFAMNRHYVPLLLVVTDLAAVHGLWFNDDVDMCLVPTQVAAARASQLGIPVERVEVTGLPVSPMFAQPVIKSELRAELGWANDRYLVLFAGSKRARKLEPLADVLNHSGLPIQLALVTGGDEFLLESWRNVEWHLPARVYGFVDNMPSMIRAADLIMCKAGGLITSESMAAGLPMLLAEVLPGQEAGNAEYVVRGGAGELVADGIEALKVICHWLERDGSLLTERAANARRLGRPGAAARVAELAWEAAHEEMKPRKHKFLDQVSTLRDILKQRTQ